MSNIPITTGTGTASVAAETISGISYQQIEVYGGGGASVLSVNPDGSFKASIIGTATVTFSGSPSISGAVTVIGTPSISGAVTIVGNASVSGTLGASIIGQLPAGNAVIGAVAASISGTPNVAISSIATANGGLHLWAPLGASWIQGTADLRIVQGASVAAIAAQGAGVRTYVNYVQIANFGSSSVLVTIADNTTSILGYTIAPAGGGSNYNSFYRSAANSPVTASINGTASVLVSMQGFTSAT